MAHRPLSPHISIYRFAYTMALSIVHRATGVFLALGFAVLVCALTQLAQGEQAWTAFTAAASSWPMQLLFALFLVSFVYHFANGIRHLVWDTGRGLERQQARRSAAFVIGFVVIASAILLWLFFGGVRA
jgi:succinate dehydrogenase / fumarate reductase, cytochrome b subunit